MTKRWLVAGAALALAGIALLCTPSDVLAQRGGGGRGGGGGGRGGGGGSWGGGGRGGWDGGRGGWDGGRGWGGGWGWGGYGLGYGGWGWGNRGYYGDYSSYSPYYYGSDYGYGYSTPDYSGYDYGYPSGGTEYYGSGSADPGMDASGYAGADMQSSQNTVMLDVNVPANAEVFVEGQKTTQTGSRRMFVSPPLTPGRSYTYDIRARWMQNGREVDQTRHVRVQTGQRTRVDFMRGMQGGSTMEEYPGPNYGREPGDRRMDDRNLRPEDRNVRPEGRTIRPADRNIRPEDRNVKPEDRNVRPEDRNVRPEDRTAPSSAPAPRDTIPSNRPKDNNPPKDNPPKDNPPPKPPDR
jgi:uncharacterized protein (TIGR03000 family)